MVRVGVAKYHSQLTVSTIFLALALALNLAPNPKEID